MYQVGRKLACLFLITCFATLVQGYHPGVEDDCVYLAAIHNDLEPQLFPHDAEFFKIQAQATIFDKLVAGFVRLTHFPVPWTAFLWQFCFVFMLLLLCLLLAERCFPEPHAQWSSTALVASLLSLPIAGTGLYLVDQYLHPRLLATVVILGAVLFVLDRRPLRAGCLLLLAFALHPIMGACGISFCLILTWHTQAWQTRARQNGDPEKTTSVDSPLRGNVLRNAAIVALPLGWIFAPVNDAWRQAADSRDYYFLTRWHWYEWFGIFAPVLLIWLFKKIGKHSTTRAFQQISSSLIVYSVFQFLVALAVLLPHQLERLRSLQPMRYLHLLYLLFFILCGGLIGQKLLRRNALRWALLFTPLCIGMWVAQRHTFPASDHLELPGRAPGNAWVEAFAWIRDNTPTDALFALNPNYMHLKGEDEHNFRALAQRSTLADLAKDPAIVTQVPSLANRWQKETDAQHDWPTFQKADLARLHSQFGVTWVVLERPVAGMVCPYNRWSVLVCQVE